MAALYKYHYIVKLDGEHVEFKTVTISIWEVSSYLNPPLIRVELKTGEVIYDDGRRVEVIIQSDE